MSDSLTGSVEDEIQFNSSTATIADVNARTAQGTATAYGTETRPQDVDPVNHPSHYTKHPSGIECIQITEHMGSNLGNVMKYVWRCDLKHDAIQDLEKAAYYLNREINKRKAIPNA